MARKEQGRIPKKILRGGWARDAFTIDGRTYTLEKVLKHDFFAVTARFRGPDGEAVCLKHYHTESWLLFPLGWAGRLMANREVRHYTLLQDMPNVPRLLGRVGDSAFAHSWVEGNDLLDQKDRLPDDFFDRLDALVREVHGRGMAYVDMNKPDNVLIGTDGRPVLIDFQISWAPDLGHWPLRFFRRRFLSILQQSDLYHVTKLKRRYRPDQMTEEERQSSYRRPWFLRMHRVVGAPLRDLRRKFLEWVGAR
jgi:RIO-like serine/threonine protein kinase